MQHEPLFGCVGVHVGVHECMWLVVLLAFCYAQFDALYMEWWCAGKEGGGSLECNVRKEEQGSSEAPLLICKDAPYPFPSCGSGK